jgi:hypothetical protein
VTALLGESSGDLKVAADYLALAPEQRYAVISKRFPSWLNSEPINFPMHHPTYGWACLVEGCKLRLRDSYPGLLCESHFREYKHVKTSVSMDDFVRRAEPLGQHGLGWALSRKRECVVCGGNREALAKGYCAGHWAGLADNKRRGISEEVWRRSQRPLPSYPPCSIWGCVHDGEAVAALSSSNRLPVCLSHREQWRKWLSNVGRQPGADAWDLFLTTPAIRDPVAPLETRGILTLARLPIRLQSEIRYGIYQHANIARRTQWKPHVLQKVVDALADARLETLSDAAVADLARRSAKTERRIWLDLPCAARSLSVTAHTAKSEGWFDPIIVGASPFPGSQGAENRRKAWNLNSISQPWLRDILWDYLRDEAVKPAGKRCSATLVYGRIAGISLLSLILRQSRADHGDDPTKLAYADAKTVKETWDLWFPNRFRFLPR